MIPEDRRESRRPVPEPASRVNHQTPSVFREVGAACKEPSVLEPAPELISLAKGTAVALRGSLGSGIRMSLLTLLVSGVARLVERSFEGTDDHLIFCACTQVGRMKSATVCPEARSRLIISPAMEDGMCIPRLSSERYPHASADLMGDMGLLCWAGVPWRS